MRTLLTAAGMAAAMLLCAPMAVASPTEAEATFDAAGRAPIRGDGWRHVAFLRPDGNPVVLDTWSVALHPIQGALNCTPTAVRGGRVLLSCPRGQDEDGSFFRGRTASVHGGRSKAIRNSAQLDEARAIGRHWVTGPPRCSLSSCPRGPAVRYVNWRTGRTVRRSYDTIGPERRTISLNHRRLRPERRRPFPVRPAFDPIADGFLTICHNQDVVISATGRGTTLWLDSRRSVPLTESAHPDRGCYPQSPLSLGRGRVAWQDGDAVHAVEYRTLETFTKAFTGGSAFSAPSIAPVRDGVVTKAEEDGAERVELLRDVP